MSTPSKMSITSSPQLCSFAFSHLSYTLSPSTSPPPPPLPLPPSSPPAPVFVTWETKSSGGGGGDGWDLRGCIGTLAPSDLARAIPDYTLTAALRDRRFRPITASELPSLRVSVSLLVDYESCSNCYDWVVGVHGIIITFTRGSSTYSATYLPEVASEHRMTREEAVASLVRKAGYEGRVEPGEISARRYQSSKCTLTYDEWMGGEEAGG
ncbi:hypothetical protein TrCOL_g12665 [Triparma columacea]|uniref:AMMECR1 domain-containing protein n=1 Tax=Triparma columacea TaxID=722753 RepID=A0A9W7GEE7_9STRA|nr:hypothetical protein TrCOL_g12665 [Triparma columacea]